MKHKRGKIIISNEFLFDCDIQVLKTLYSIFYPIAIEDDFKYGFNKNKILYGYSELFNEIEEGIETPEYIVTFKSILSSDNKQIIEIENISLK
jgi:hypothetical protein